MIDGRLGDLSVICRDHTLLARQMTASALSLSVDSEAHSLL